MNAPQGWNPLCDRAATCGEGCFTPPEILDVNEKSKAAYLMLRFGGPEANLGSVNVVGNIGVRYVQTDISSHGYVGFPNSQWYTTRWRPARAPAIRPTTAPTRPPTSSAGSRPSCWPYSTGTGTAEHAATRLRRTCCPA